MDCFDLIIVGAGAAGMPAAIFAAEAGADILLIEADTRVGGTFFLSSGQMSAAGSRLQAAKGISDDPDAHFADVMRISHGTADPALVRVAVDNAVDTLHWLLDNGLEVLPEHPVIYPGHEPYTVARTCWAPEKGQSVLRAIEPQLDRAIGSGRVTLWLETRLTGLTRDATGAVTGARVLKDGVELTVLGKSVLLATGGFTGNAALTLETTGGFPCYSGGNPLCTGDGLKAATDIGAAVANRGVYLPIFAAVADERSAGGYLVSTQTNPLWRLPWEIFVDDNGRRFYAEDQTSCDVRETALKGVQGMRFWAVWDEAIREAAPPFFTDRSLETSFGKNDNYVVADTLEALATATGMDIEILRVTVTDYNADRAAGTPDALGRTHRPLPIGQPPFYAVRHHGWSITSFAGLRIDAQCRVIDEAGAPIPNLYAAGEVIGFGQTSGAAFASGMSVTPAMTFGRLLGKRLGARHAAEIPQGA